jgi:hypothetical protein
MICDNPKCRFNVPMPDTVPIDARMVTVLESIKPMTINAASKPEMKALPKHDVYRHPYYIGGRYTPNPVFHLCESCNGAVEFLEQANR